MAGVYRSLPETSMWGRAPGPRANVLFAGIASKQQAGQHNGPESDGYVGNVEHPCAHWTNSNVDEVDNAPLVCDPVNQVPNSASQYQGKE
jgi:hypothetical protein